MSGLTEQLPNSQPAPASEVVVTVPHTCPTRAERKPPSPQRHPRPPAEAPLEMPVQSLRHRPARRPGHVRLPSAPRRMALRRLLVIGGAVLMTAVAANEMYKVLTAGTLAYLGSLPFGFLSYRDYERRSREGRAEPAATVATPATSPAPAALAPDLVRHSGNEDRPSRLN